LRRLATPYWGRAAGGSGRAIPKSARVLGIGDPQRRSDRRYA